MASLHAPSLKSPAVPRPTVRDILDVVASYRPVPLLLLVLLHLILHLSIIFPYVYQLNPQDAPEHIIKGRLLVNSIAEGRFSLPSFQANPLIAFLYAIIYIPLHKHPYWLIVTEWIARFVLFLLLWVSAYLIACRLRKYADPLIVVGLLFVMPVIPRLIENNATDALFAATSGLAFWQVLAFQQTRKSRHLWLASAFLGLAAHSRNDGLVLFVVFTTIVVVLAGIRGEGVGRGITSVIAHPIVASIIPFAVLVGGYIVVLGILTGSFDTGTPQRAYINFEIAQATVYSSRLESVEDGILEARRLYGTPEENNYSVLNAIMRNPRAFIDRVLHLSIGVIPTTFRAYSSPFVVDGIMGYGDILGGLLLILAILGLIELIRTKSYALAVIFELWSAFLLVYFAFHFIERYTLLPYFVVIGLAAIGVNWFSRIMFRREVGYVGIAMLGAAVALGLVTQDAHLLTGGGIAAALLLAVWALGVGRTETRSMVSVGLLVLLCGGLLMRGPFAEPRIPVLGASGEERVALYMRENFDYGTRVAAYAPSALYMAKMQWVPLIGDVHTVATDEEFAEWLEENDVKAIYVDYLLEWLQPGVYAAIERQVGKSLTEVMSVEDRSPERERFVALMEKALDVELSRSHRVLVVRPTP